MIRKVTIQDAQAIADIYNEYVLNSVASFETEPITELEMRKRIEEISSKYPYYVYEDTGEVKGYCYAHSWKERAAYKQTWETTIYVAADLQGRGIGTKLMNLLIEECRQAGAHALIACITGGNEKSILLHQQLGFRQVSQFPEVGMKFGRWLDVVDFQLLLCQ